MNRINKEKLVKFTGAFFGSLTVLNFIFFVLGKINYIQFWFIIILCALVAFFGLPMMRKTLLEK